MSMPQVPAVEAFLPDWSVRRFLVVDKSGRWPPAIAAQVMEQLRDRTGGDQDGGSIVFDSFTTTKDLAPVAQQINTAALVIFLDGLERECLTLLRRFVLAPRRPAILIVADEHHQELMPVLLESGVDSLLFDVVNDIPIAEWCLRLLPNRSYSGNAVRTDAPAQ
ncbi:MAG: hypothetical protein GY903_05195 [Fuerstiella sp.]|nr:hypothetical protein [Fuerstiella sp.]MCP4853870.1 hypothetical protein [Fuerstiella sp.]